MYLPYSDTVIEKRIVILKLLQLNWIIHSIKFAIFQIRTAQCQLHFLEPEVSSLIYVIETNFVLFKLLEFMCQLKYWIYIVILGLIDH